MHHSKKTQSCKWQYIVFLLSVCFIFHHTYAQDIIFLKKGNVIESKIIKVDQGKIYYKKFNYQEGPTFTIFKSNVEKVIYENGESEMFKSDWGIKEYLNPEQETSGKKETEPYHNIIGWRPFTPIYRSLGISYERMIKDNFGLKFPLILNFDGYYRAGADVKYYILTHYNMKTGRTKDGLYLGPSIRTGTIGNLAEEGIDLYYSGYTLSQKTSLMLLFGGSFYLINNVGVEINFGSGAMVDDYEIIPSITGGIFIICGF